MEPQDFAVSNPPGDDVSGLEFSSRADFLAASSWDNKIRIYEVESSGNTVPKAAYDHTGPALCVTWSKDGTRVVSGGGDNVAIMYDISTQTPTTVARHDNTIKCVKFVGESILATGSWDKTIKYWDLRAPQPVKILQLPERCYTMDSHGDRLVAGTADRHIVIVELREPDKIKQQLYSPLKWQTKTVACHIDGSGYAVGSIEGRVGVRYFKEEDDKKKFSFKCYDTPAAGTNQASVFGQPQTKASKNSINAINFHPVYGTFSTVDGNGLVAFWDKDNKRNLQKYYTKHGSITCSAYSAKGNIFAYASSYDWTNGPSGRRPNTQIFLHPVTDGDSLPRPKDA